MGKLLSSTQINPNQPADTHNSLFNYKGEVSRSNFKLVRKVATCGIEDQAVLWFAHNIANPTETFFLKQISKLKVYNHKRVQAVIDQMHLLTQSNNPYIIKTYFAFQDYEYLYLVTEAIHSVKFQSLLKTHIFSEDQTRYVVSALISILEYVHAKGLALTELSPKNIHFNRQNGQLRLIDMTNPAKIDEYCCSNVVSDVCPYSAPEILLRDKVLAQCDFYSLGIIIYEMMTQETAIPLQQGKQTFERNLILMENIEVQKSQIPEEWQPESADFLIKLLIKSPNLRLGRYGSFEVKNHAWLKEFQLDGQFKKGIDLKDLEITTHELVSNQSQAYEGKNRSPELINNYFFQQLFQDYKFEFKKNLVFCLKNIDNIQSEQYQAPIRHSLINFIFQYIHKHKNMQQLIISRGEAFKLQSYQICATQPRIKLIDDKSQQCCQNNYNSKYRTPLPPSAFCQYKSTNKHYPILQKLRHRKRFNFLSLFLYNLQQQVRIVHS